MIVTQALLLAVGGCAQIVQHLIDTGYGGLLRQEFIDKMQQDADAGIHPQWWVSWSKVYLKNGDAIFFNGEYVKLDEFRVFGFKLADPTQIYSTIEDARVAEVAAEAAQNASEEWMFHVHAVCPTGEDQHTLETCDLDGDGVFDHPVTVYQVFNYLTGLYEDYEFFDAAQLRCRELQQERQSLIALSYVVEQKIQQINDPEENPSAWIRYDKLNPPV
jgi:hypothetical protein